MCLVNLLHKSQTEAVADMRMVGLHIFTTCLPGLYHISILNMDAFTQGRNYGKIFGATSAMVGRICPPPGLNRVKENLGATGVAPVTPVNTSLPLVK